MFRMNGNRRKKVSKGKHSNQMEKTAENKTQYTEDFNEIILNDLVPEEKRAELGLESQSEKKSGGLKLNLGLGTKKSSKKSSSNKVEENKQNNKKTPKSGKSANSESKNQKASKHKSNKPSSDLVDKHKKTNAKPKKSTKQSQTEAYEEVRPIQETEEVVQQPKQSKKSHKKNLNQNKRRRKQNIQEEELEVKNNIEFELEEINQDEYISEESSDSILFRGKQQEQEFNEENLKNKFEDLVWSEDKFPKK